jgi:CheY-like chemotaxis protein
MILANMTQLHQILMNLCSNAEYAMRQTGGILEIGVHTVEADATPACCQPALEPKPWVRLTVRDTGAGIPSEIVERIFDPFFTTKGVGEGTGMGLAIVHGIVTSYGGAVRVTSQAGVGTTCRLYFPQLRNGAWVASEAPIAVVSPSPSRILLVDDEEMLARLGQEMLEYLGYEVTAHTRSLEALTAFQADPQGFDLVITDQTMPEMPGERLVQELRRLRPDIPIILCTGFSHRMTAENVQALGIDACVMKPVVTQELAVVIARVFTQRAGHVLPSTSETTC